jgi:GT2 family glycosyltransferase
MCVSIVIATADRREMVLDCVRCLAVQIPAEVEVVVVDAGSEDPVMASPMQALWPNSKVLRSSIRNAGAQRNMGVTAAQGEIIVFVDDDCFVQPGWWPAIVAPLSDGGPQTTDYGPRTGDRRPQTGDRRQRTIDYRPETGEQRPEDGQAQGMDSRTTHQAPSTKNEELPIAAVAGAVWCNEHPKFTDRRGGYVNWLGYPVQVTHRGDKAPRDVDWPMTTNMAVRRDVFLAVGGFATVYGIYDEDVDLGLKIRRAGWAIRFVPDAAVYHYYRRRPARPVTKASQFLLGRNRSILLVRNYGLVSRVWIHLLAQVFQQAGLVAVRIARFCVQAIGHAAAFMAGMVWGIRVGCQHAVRDDAGPGDEETRKSEG